MKLSDKFKNDSLKARTYNLFTLFLNHWFQPLNQAQLFADEAYKAALDTGELDTAGYILMGKIVNLFCQGKPLVPLLTDIIEFLQFARKTQHQFVIDILLAFQLVLFKLVGPTKTLNVFYEDELNETQYVDNCQQKHRMGGICMYHILKSMTFYLLSDFTSADQHVRAAEAVCQQVSAMSIITEHNFYSSLTLTALYPKTSKTSQPQTLKKLNENQEQMKIWADNCSENFLHKYILITAEIANISGQPVEEVMNLYDQAIMKARQNGFIQHEALANELAAKFWLNQKKKEFARIYLNRAVQLYKNWGAKRKTEELTNKYPYLITSIKIDPTRTESTILATRIFPSSIYSSNWLDLKTVVKASHILSGEIVLHKLLEKMMRIVIENAGAQKGILLLPIDNQWVIEAEGDIDKKITVLQAVRLEDSEQVSSNVIYYVARTRDNVILHDAVQEGFFIRDPYIVKYRPKSVLCVPLQHQRQLSGILYLENNLTTGAFTSGRAELINLLSSQMAISIENAKLYTKVHNNENRLRQFLEAIPVGIRIFDTHGKITYVNQKAKHIFGTNVTPNVTVDRLAQACQMYCTHTGLQYPTQMLPVRRALQGESSSVDDLEVRQDDRIIPLENWGTPIFDEQGNLTYAISVFQDISERLEKEKAEREREAAEAVNKKIIESLHYANSIQNSLLPNLERIQKYLPNSFILWLPRDIVGGDMIYMELFQEHLIITVMDCTGHGVPGAFMTMVASTNLRRITRDEKYHQPAYILKRLNVMVQTSLQQDTEYATSDDGLDAAISVIDFKTKTLTFAGARLPLYYIQDDKLTIIKGDKQSLGYKNAQLDFIFTSHTLEFRENMAFYLATDGFTDQLGGPKHCSFGKKRFKTLLLENYHHPFQNQREKLLETFKTYQGEDNRKDDVTVVGFGF